MTFSVQVTFIGFWKGHAESEHWQDGFRYPIIAECIFKGLTWFWSSILHIKNSIYQRPRAVYRLNYKLKTYESEHKQGYMIYPCIYRGGLAFGIWLYSNYPIHYIDLTWLLSRHTWCMLLLNTYSNNSIDIVCTNLSLH